jgi:hypothetical protein
MNTTLSLILFFFYAGVGHRPSKEMNREERRGEYEAVYIEYTTPS